MSKDRSTLYKDCWRKAEEARGSVDGWDFKNYILGFLFYRYISEDFVSWIEKEMNKNGGNEKYEDVSDDEEWLSEMNNIIIGEKGFFIAPSHLFSKVLENAKYEHNLSDTLTNIFKTIEETVRYSEEGAKQAYYNIQHLLTSIDLYSPKLGNDQYQKNEKIIEVMQKISEMDLSSEYGSSEIFGKVYEYLICEYSSTSGKSKGEFYTPPEVSELLVRLSIVDAPSVRSVYDPACGSGSLLIRFLKFVDEKKREEIKLFGQEINQTTYHLCKVNMYLHKMGFNKFKIECGDTLLEDKFKDRYFDIIVSNPPCSIKWDGKDNPSLVNDERFSRYGVLASKNRADMAFIQHCAHHLNHAGIAVMVCCSRILFREGAEQIIRQHLVKQNLIDAVIKLPANLFFRNETSSCIIVLKNNIKPDSSILFIDASELFVQVTNRNKLDKDSIQQILDYYKNRVNVDNYVYLASYDEVEKKEFNLSVSSYVVKEETEEEIDIEKLSEGIDKSFERMNDLRSQISEWIKNF